VRGAPGRLLDRGLRVEQFDRLKDHDEVGGGSRRRRARREQRHARALQRIP
jgi:hypothetical protein